MLRKNYFLFLILAVFLFFPFVIRAIGAGGISAGPAYPDPDIPYSNSYFIYNLDKNETKDDGIRTINNTGKKVLVKLYPVDAVVTKQGAFAPLAETDIRKDIGAWVKLDALEITLEPDEERIVPFTITIPENADVGDHLGAIIVEKSILPTVEGTGVVIKTRVGIRIYETVPGEIIKALKISNVVWKIGIKKLSDKPTTGQKIKTALGLSKEGFLTLEIKNEGNVHLNPTAKIEIKDLLGNHAATLDKYLEITAPKGTTFIPVKWEKPALFGRFTANVEVIFGDNQRTYAKISFWIIPWTIIFIIVVLIIIIVFIKFFWKLFYLMLKLRKMPKMTSHKITKKETLIDIADKFEIKWKKLARINNLKAPYELKKGQIIYIPKKGKGKGKTKEKEKKKFFALISQITLIPLKIIKKIIKKIKK